MLDKTSSELVQTITSDFFNSIPIYQPKILTNQTQLQSGNNSFFSKTTSKSRTTTIPFTKTIKIAKTSTFQKAFTMIPVTKSRKAETQLFNSKTRPTTLDSFAITSFHISTSTSITATKNDSTKLPFILPDIFQSTLNLHSTTLGYKRVYFSESEKSKISLIILIINCLKSLLKKFK
jgi:hypothetical protein